MTSLFKQAIKPCALQGYGLRLLPMSTDHAQGIATAVADGQLWHLRVTSAPEPDNAVHYIQKALDGQKLGHMLPFVVMDDRSGKIIGTSRYHDIIPEVARLEIGYTWYAKSYQRSFVNTACKLLLLTHAFETLSAQIVGWRTDNFNFASQRAIERLGAKRDGIIRGNALRRDGTIRDTVMYSLSTDEWPNVKAHLEYQIELHK